MACLLIAEDDPAAALLITTLFRLAGHSVLSARNGHEAIGLLECQPVDALPQPAPMPASHQRTRHECC